LDYATDPVAVPHGGVEDALAARELGALRGPASLQDLRQPVDDDVEEAADAQADHGGRGQRDRRIEEGRHRARDRRRA